MSRYEFDVGEFSFSIGYDVRLKTYFGFVERKNADDGEPLVRIGEAARAYPDSDSFIREFTESARGAGVENITLSQEMRSRLENDRCNSPAATPCLLQS